MERDPSALKTSSVTPSAASLTTAYRVRRCDVVVRLQIASRASGSSYRQILDFMPQVKVGRTHAVMIEGPLRTASGSELRMSW